MTRVRMLNTLAGLTWYAGAAALLFKGSKLLHQAQNIQPHQVWPWVALAAGVLVGVIKARYMLVESCRKNLSRIANLSQPRWWQFFHPRFFLFLAIVITLGVTASRQAEGHYGSLCVVGAVDLSVGVGLLVSGLAVLRPRLVSSPSLAAGTD